MAGEADLEYRAHQQEVGWNAALTVVSRFGFSQPDYHMISLGDLRKYIEELKK